MVKKNQEKKQEKLARTPLYDLVVQQKAKLTAFSGWEMPVQFSGLKQEHEAVRNHAGMFDISHMGKFVLKGKELRQKLQTLVPSDLLRLQPNQAQYTVLLNTEGGIIDDIIFYYQGESSAEIEQGLMIVNAATTITDKAWLLSQLDSETVEFKDISREKVLIALQGPSAAQYLQEMIKVDLQSMKAFNHLETEILGESAFIARTGYTGEDGFEIMVAPDTGKKVWQHFLEKGVTPCGLGARDTLRLEAAMCLYGQDIDEITTPLEAGLSWLVHLDTKGDFIGRDILAQQKANKIQRRLVALEMQGRYIARHGYRVLINGEEVGIITSGTLAPTVNKAIALAYLPLSLAKVGTQVDVEIRGKTYPALVVKKPFYRSPYRI